MTDSPITVVIADDHELFRDGLRAMLSTADGIDVLADVGTGTEAIEVAMERRPDIVLLDVEMPGIPSLSVLHRLRADLPETKTLIVTMHRDRALASQLIGAGAPESSRKRPRQQSSSKRFATPIAAPAEPLRSRHLSESSPHANAKCSARSPTAVRRRDRENLSIAIGTVKRHNSQIFTKLGARSRTDAVRRAQRIGELDRTEYTDSDAQEQIAEELTSAAE